MLPERAKSKPTIPQSRGQRSDPNILLQTSIAIVIDQQDSQAYVPSYGYPLPLETWKDFFGTRIPPSQSKCRSRDIRAVHVLAFQPASVTILIGKAQTIQCDMVGSYLSLPETPYPLLPRERSSLTSCERRRP